MDTADWTLASLCDAHRRGDALKYLFFWGHTAPADGSLGPHVFSQWYPSPFEVDGQVFATAEHWMMAGKAKLFGDEEALARVHAAKTPAQAKKIGRQVRNFDDATWKAHCLELVTDGSVHKFSATPELRDYLLATGKRILVEASPTDRVWGIGLARDSPKASDPTQWRGDNLLGFALMNARTRLAAG